MSLPRIPLTVPPSAAYGEAERHVNLDNRQPPACPLAPGRKDEKENNNSIGQGV